MTSLVLVAESLPPDQHLRQWLNDGPSVGAVRTQLGLLPEEMRQRLLNWYVHDLGPRLQLSEVLRFAAVLRPLGYLPYSAYGEPEAAALTEPAWVYRCSQIFPKELAVGGIWYQFSASKLLSGSFRLDYFPMPDPSKTYFDQNHSTLATVIEDTPEAALTKFLYKLAGDPRGKAGERLDGPDDIQLPARPGEGYEGPVEVREEPA